MTLLAFRTWVDYARAVHIEAVLRARNIALRGRNGRLAGPCPLCGGDDRFAVDLNKQLFVCRGCNIKGAGAIALVCALDGVGFLPACETLTGELPPKDDVHRGLVKESRRPPTSVALLQSQPQSLSNYERRQQTKAKWLWSCRQPIAGSPVEHYLRVARGIAGTIPSTIGYLPASDGYPPTMIGAYAVCAEPEPGAVGEPQDVGAVHLTRLLPDGSDRERGRDAKITVARPLGRPIVIAPPNDVLAIGIAEGIEDAFAPAALGLGAWAAGSASFMPALADTIPSYVESVTIYAHDDPSGQGGTRGLAERLHQRGVEVLIEGLL